MVFQWHWELNEDSLPGQSLVRVLNLLLGKSLPSPPYKTPLFWEPSDVHKAALSAANHVCPVLSPLLSDDTGLSLARISIDWIKQNLPRSWGWLLISFHLLPSPSPPWLGVTTCPCVKNWGHSLVPMQSTTPGAPTLTSKSWVRRTLLCFSKYYWTVFFFSNKLRGYGWHYPWLLFFPAHTQSLFRVTSLWDTQVGCVSQDKGSQVQPILVLRLCSLRPWLSVLLRVWTVEGPSCEWGSSVTLWDLLVWELVIQVKLISKI